MAPGLLRGLGGSMALYASDAIERRVLGRRPVYAPERISAGLSRRWLGRAPSPSRARLAGGVLRAGYGAGLGAATSLLQSLPRWRRVLASGLSIFAFEVWMMPRVGATPPVRRWPRAEVAMLLAHTLAYAALTERLRSPSPQGRGPSRVAVGFKTLGAIRGGRARRRTAVCSQRPRRHGG